MKSAGFLFADNFQRANVNPLAAPWTSTTGGVLKLVSNAATPAASSVYAAMYYAGTFPRDQYSQITIGTLTASGDSVGPAVRVTAAGAGYAVKVPGPIAQTNTGTIEKLLGGGVVASFSITPNSGDTITLQVLGNQLTVLQNGLVIATALDGTYPSGGNAGIQAFQATSAVLDNFTCGSMTMVGILNTLGGANTAYIAELITITLADGTVLNYTTGEENIVFGGVTFSANGPLPIIGQISWRLGVEVDTLKLQLWALMTNLVESIAILQGVVQGKFDNALVLIQRVFMPTWGDVSAGSIILFQGNVSDVPVADASHAEFDVKSRKELLNIPLPYRTYQPGCRWALYGPGCTLNASSFVVSGTLSAGSGQLLLNTNLTNVDQYFNEGLITFTGGNNTGVTRGVRQYVHASGQVLLFIPLLNLITIGDTFNIYPGCDKQQSTCNTKFSNLINFGGMPYIPIPESGV